MNRKLLASTALAGVMFAGSSFAQTTVTGNLNLSYKAIGSSGSSAATNSSRFFGKEVQIDIQNKGKLNNGLDYAAGFSIEHDGGQLSSQSTTTTTDSLGIMSENVYIDFIAGNTTFSIGADHGQNPDNEPANLVGVVDFDDLVAGINNKLPNYNSVAKAGSAYEAFGISVSQKTPVGSFIARYIPSSNTGLAGPDDGGVGTAAPSLYDAGESIYELGFRGDLGVKGLDLQAYYDNKTAGGVGANGNIVGKFLGVKYNAGDVTFAVAEKRLDTVSNTNNVSTKGRSYGVAYAVDKNITLGVAYAVTDEPVSATNVSTPNKEKIKQVSLGYNLGPVFTGVSYGRVENNDNTAGSNGSAGMVFLGTKF
jgi:hypothetical protein